MRGSKCQKRDVEGDGTLGAGSAYSYSLILIIVRGE